MARKTRENQPGGVYHVFARGNDRELIYRDDVDRRMYLARLEKAVHKFGWHQLAYCLMNNHVHLLIETPQANLSEGMRALHSGYAQTFNLRHGRVGHVFQGRYGAVLMERDAQVCAAAAYIARNPVEAGLCRAPEQWPWSSFALVFGGRTPGWLDAARLISFFGARPGSGRDNYVEMSYRERQQVSKEGLTPW
jgi:putative transposase